MSSNHLPANAHETQTTSERIINIVCCCLVASSFVLRFLGRYCQKKRNDCERINTNITGRFFGLDDIFNFFAVLTFAGFAIAEFKAIERGMGTHVEVVLFHRGQKGLDRYNESIYVCALFYNLVIGFYKLSVLGLYLRILNKSVYSALHVAIWVVLGIVSANTLINVFVAAFQCVPIRAAFDSSVKGRCINASAFYLGNSITGIITDLMVYALVVFILKPLQMRWKQKLAIFFTLSVGLFAVITSCVRLGFLPSLLKDPDTTWAMGVPMNWSIVEPTVGIIVSSMPAISGLKHISYLARSVTSTLASSQRDTTRRVPSLKPHSDGHIQLHDIQKGMGANTVIHTGVQPMSGKDNLTDDNESEEHLISAKNRGIAKTVDVKVAYSSD